MQRANVVDIKRFAVHDGDGIRTTVFLKGCPLKCVWCHNPEGISPNSRLAYYDHKCINCGMCVKACPNGAHTFDGEKHRLSRSLCQNCGACEEVCLGDALKLYGKEYTSDELLPLLSEDKDFYDNSGGGVTISGGECLIYADFCGELLKKLKKEGINTAVDTCGYVSKEALDKVMPYTDVFLYDIKAISEEVHIKCTGKSNKIILENLKYLREKQKKVEIRIPYVPGFNSEEIYKIFDFLKDFDNVVKIKVLAYHNYAGSKYKALDMKDTLPRDLPTEEEIERLQKKADLICGGKI